MNLVPGMVITNIYHLCKDIFSHVLSIFYGNPFLLFLRQASKEIMVTHNLLQLARHLWVEPQSRDWGRCESPVRSGESQHSVVPRCWLSAGVCDISQERRGQPSHHQIWFHQHPGSGYIHIDRMKRSLQTFLVYTKPALSADRAGYFSLSMSFTSLKPLPRTTVPNSANWHRRAAGDC